MSKRFPPTHQLRTGNSTDRQQTPVASLSDVFSLHAATTSTPQFSLPQVRSVSELSHASVHFTQDGTLLSRALGELEVISSTSVPSKQVPISSARFRHPCQQPWMTSWLSSSPLLGCNLITTSLSHPDTSEGTAASEPEEGSFEHQRSAQFQVHAKTQTLSIAAPHLAGCFSELDMLRGDSCQSLLMTCYPLAVSAYVLSRSVASNVCCTKAKLVQIWYFSNMPQLLTAYGRHQYTCKHTDTAPDTILLATTLLAAILLVTTLVQCKQHVSMVLLIQSGLKGFRDVVLMQVQPM